MDEKINLLETPGRSGFSHASVLEILTFVAPPPGHRLWANSWRSLPCPSHHGPSTESDWSTAPLENSLKEKKKRYENYPETIMKKREEGNHEREVNVEQRQKMERSTDGEEKVIMEQSWAHDLLG